MKRAIFLLVQFNWPRPFQVEHGQKAKALHEVLQGETWIEDVVAASGGVGGGPSSLWIFKLQSYAALDRLFHDEEDPVAAAYTAFFSEMVDVEDMIREEVIFS